MSEDSNPGTVTVVLPPNLSPCGPLISNPNTAQGDYFIVASAPGGATLTTGAGATVTGDNVVLISPNGSVGTAGTAFSTAATNLTAYAPTGLVNIADNNGTTGVTLTPRAVFGTTYDNTASTSYNSLNPVVVPSLSATQFQHQLLVVKSRSITMALPTATSLSTTMSRLVVPIAKSPSHPQAILPSSQVLSLPMAEPSGSVILTADGPNGVGTCPNPILLNTQDVTGNAPNGTVALTDSSPAVISGSNASKSEWKLTDNSNSASAISFASGSSVSSNYVILYAPNGGLNLNNSTISITNSGVAEIVSDLSITGVPTSISGPASTLEIASLTGSIGTSTTPVTFATPNFSATAVNGSVYVDDSNPGTVTVVLPPNLSPCGPLISNPNTALGDYFIVASAIGGATLATGAGATVTGDNVALISPNGSVGTAGTPFSTAATNLTAYAPTGLVNLADNNGTTGVTLTPRNVFGTTYDNTASTSYKLVESGSGPVTISDTVATSAASGQITINDTGAANGNIIINNNVTASGVNSQISFSASGDITDPSGAGTLTTNGGASGGVTLTANGPNGVGSCPIPILLNTQHVTGNAPNGTVALSDSSPAIITGSNAGNAINGEWKLTDTAAANPSISFAPGSTVNAYHVILYASQGSIDFTGGTVTVSNLRRCRNCRLFQYHRRAGEHFEHSLNPRSRFTGR